MKIVINLFFLVLVSLLRFWSNKAIQENYNFAKMHFLMITFLSNHQPKSLGEMTYSNNKHTIYSSESLKVLSDKNKAQYLYKLVQQLKQYDRWSNNFIESYWNQILLVSLSKANQNSIASMTLLSESPQSFRFRKLWRKQIIHDLSTGRMNFDMPIGYTSQFSLLNFENHTSYLWKKGLNFPLPERLNFFKRNQRTINWPNERHKSIMNNLNLSTVLIPINSFYQMIFSIPQIELKKNVVDKLFFTYFDLFIWQKDSLSTPLKQGFFFFHLEDAKEFILECVGLYPRSSSAKRYGPLRIFPLRLSIAYKWIRTSRPRLQFRLIPDVKEIGNLLFKYKYYKNINFHPSQKIKNNEFQGIPIYIIQPILIEYDKKEILLPYSASLDPIQGKLNCQFLFTSLEGAYYSWRNFKLKYSHFNLPETPNILVYNLEGYIRDCEEKFCDDCKHFRVIPNKDVVDILKANSFINHTPIQSFYFYKIIPAFKKFTLWSKYCFWAFTTRKKPDW